MNFNTHFNLAGTHALLSASDYHWLRYDEDKLSRVYYAKMAARRGVELHAFAHEAIRLGQELPDNGTTLSRYVNDAIGFKMACEVCLFYSVNCYGHADCISFRNLILRIHDLKTGQNEASFDQLLIYAALFCLEYKTNPFSIKIELRIYQNDEVHEHTADPDEIMHIMEKIKFFDKHLNYLRSEDS